MTTVTLYAVSDTRLSSASSTTNFGTGEMRVGDASSSSNAATRSLVKFDLSSIPAGSLITAVTLSLYEYVAGKTGGGVSSWAVNLQRMLRNFVEMEATWLIYSTGNSWTTAGAGSDNNDRSPIISATVTLDGTPASAYINWTGAFLTDDVQKMVNGTYPNYGWLIDAPDANYPGIAATSFNSFRSREFVGAELPMLVVTYTLATPGYTQDTFVSTPPTSARATGICVHQFKPSIVPTAGTYDPEGVWIGDLTPQLTAWSHIIGLKTGFESASASLACDLLTAQDWLEDGLMRHIVCYTHQGQIAWEGFVNAVSVSLGNITAKAGPVTDVANRVGVTYARILRPNETATDEVVASVPDITVLADNTPSQERYGIIERWITAGELIVDPDDTPPIDQATQAQSMYLEMFGFPETTQELSGGGGVPTVTLELLGYQAFLDFWVYNDPADSLSITIYTKMLAVLAADNNNILSTDHGEINENLLAVGSAETENRTARVIIDELVNFGDSSDNLFSFGVYENRKVFYQAVSAIAEYVYTGGHSINQFATYSGNPVEPWEIRPGKYIRFIDFLPGYTGDTLRPDPRTMLIESVTYTMPWDAQIAGTRYSTLRARLNKLGVGGV